MSTYKYMHRLHQVNKNLFTFSDLQSLLKIDSRRTLEDVLRKMVQVGVLTHLEKGKYLLSEANSTDFELAGFLYSPSYISFETALNYWGILSQFPLEITSATTKSPVQKIIDDKAYVYTKLSHKIFTGFTKENNFLMALPEKALFDQLYLIAKGLKTIQYLDEMDYSSLSEKEFSQYLPLVTQKLRQKIESLWGGIL